MSADSSLAVLPGNASQPLYQRIKEAIAGKIHSGQWRPGRKIPSENTLASELGVSRMTINRPLRELSSEGLLKRVPGLGTFVAEPPRHASLIALRPIAEEIVAQGKIHRARLLSLRQIGATRTQGERMGVRIGAPLFYIGLVHYQDEVPIQLETRHVNPALVPDFMRVDFGGTTPSEYLIEHIRPDEIEHLVQAITPSARTAMHLSIPPREPCLRLRRRTWKGGVVVTAADLIYPSSRYDLGARYQTPT